ncbi:MAG: DUF3800 domain-containing protein [Anaerolineales bacterium]
MKTPQPGATWFFVDESGDPTFYDKRGNLIVGQEGCSPILLLGLIETQSPQPMREAVLDLQRQIVNDPYFRDFPSIQKTAAAFHAKDDLREVRYLFYRLIATLDFKAQFIVARKIERVFRNSFQARETHFYDHLVSRLFQNLLHRYQHNFIYFSKRGSRARQIPLLTSIQQAVVRFEQKWNRPVTTGVDVQAQTPQGEPCLSVIDYMNWAVYRAFTRGEMQYYRTVEHKVSLLVDLYDTANYPANWYKKRNPFDVKKITPL